MKIFKPEHKFFKDFQNESIRKFLNYYNIFGKGLGVFYYIHLRYNGYKFYSIYTKKLKILRV